MTAPIDAYPLTWPAAQPRTPPAKRRRGAFGTKANGGYYSKQPLTIAQALDRVRAELTRLRASDVVISSNLSLRLDGLPRSDQREPEDPGVAVYFRLEGTPHALPCDRWDRVADNLAAIAAHVEATRGIARWGVGSLAQAFAGYQALPASTARPWREILGLDGQATLADAEAAYRGRARAVHPDRGGSEAAMAELNAAIAEARRELGRPA